jgi:ribosomal protein S18 acetylase RimI-like enzyme
VAAELPQLLAMPGASSYCLREDVAKPLGFGQYWVETADSVHLGRIIVSPHERGRGLGKTLCQLLVTEAARRTGAARATLRVYKDNAAAIAIYSSLGFVVVERESMDDVFTMEAQTNLGIRG